MTRRPGLKAAGGIDRIRNRVVHVMATPDHCPQLKLNVMLNEVKGE